MTKAVHATAVWAQPRRVVCSHCDEPFVYLATGETKSVAGGATLESLGLTQDQIPAPRGYAVQCRVNTEKMNKKGNPLPSGGTLTAFEPPSGPGLRTPPGVADSFGATFCMANSPNFGCWVRMIASRAWKCASSSISGAR